MTAPVDRRRRMWVAVPVDLLREPLGRRLQQDYGPAGLAVWVAYLAACKRSPIEGRFQYGSEVEAWQQLGFTEPPAGISLTAFFKTTGAMKETSRSHYGDLTQILCSRFEELQKPRRRPPTDQQASWSTPRNAPRKRRRYDGDRTSDNDIDNDNDISSFLADAVQPLPRADSLLRIDEEERRRQRADLGTRYPEAAAE